MTVPEVINDLRRAVQRSLPDTTTEALKLAEMGHALPTSITQTGPRVYPLTRATSAKVGTIADGS